MVLLGWISFWMTASKRFLSWFVPSVPLHSVPWTIHQPPVWGAIRFVQTQCKHAPKFRGYKALFPKITLKPLLGGNAKEADSPFTPTPTNKVAAALLRDPPTSPCSISTLQLVYILVLILYLVSLLQVLTLIVLFPCWYIGCPRNFIIFANNDNVMSPCSILLPSPSSFLTHWPGPSLLCKLSTFLTFSQP